MFRTGLLTLACVHALATGVHASRDRLMATVTQTDTSGRGAPIELEAPIANQQPDLPKWAFTSNPPRKAPRQTDDGTLLHVPGSPKSYTRTQINDGSHAPDWFPETHPVMPNAVASGGNGYRDCVKS